MSGSFPKARVWVAVSLAIAFCAAPKTDILYIAKSSANPSGINLSDGSGPNRPLQSWPEVLAAAADYPSEATATGLVS